MPAGSRRPPGEGRPKSHSGNRRKRELSAEEQALWRDVARSVTARPGMNGVEHKLQNSSAIERATDSAEPATPRPPVKTPKPPSRPPTARRAHGAPPPPREPVDRLGPSTPGLDRNTARRLKQGKLSPEARIDLHGMTVARAHDALFGFIRREHAAGSRCVLVITGKGGARRQGGDEHWRMGDETGVLKSMTPQWLRQAPLGALVVGVYPAHQRHGGAGALYVYLRKTR